MQALIIVMAATTVAMKIFFIFYVFYILVIGRGEQTVGCVSPAVKALLMESVLLKEGTS